MTSPYLILCSYSAKQRSYEIFQQSRGHVKFVGPINTIQKDTRNPENWIYRQFINQDVGKLNLGETCFWAND